MLHAIHTGTSKTVEIGDEIIDFRGDKAILVSLDRARTLGKSGLITYNYLDGMEGGCVYDKVFNLEVVEK